MHAAVPFQTLNTTALDTDSRAGRAVGVHDAVEHARPAPGAKIAIHRATIFRGARPQLQASRKLGREREQAVCREDGRRAEGGRCLLLTFGAVAVEQRDGLRRRRRERYVSTLTPHCERLGIRRGHGVKCAPYLSKSTIEPEI